MTLEDTLRTRHFAFQLSLQTQVTTFKEVFHFDIIFNELFKIQNKIICFFEILSQSQGVHNFI